MSDRLRALVLCAGHGTRLRPLTLTLPKPLVPVCGEPVAGRTLRSLAAAGCELAAINLHHRGDAIRQQLGERCGEMPLVYSEEREILGTLGALVPLRATLRAADAILLVNGDALAAWPWQKLLGVHRKTGAAATLLLDKAASPAAFGSGVGIDTGGRVVQIRDSQAIGEVVRRFVFTGAHVLDPSLLDDLPTGPADIVGDLYKRLLAAGDRIESVVTGSRWHDLGTPDRYREGVLDWARGSVPKRLWRGVWSAARTDISAEAVLRRVVVEDGACIEAGAHVVDSLLLPGARVPAGVRVVRSIIGPRVTLPAGAQIDERLVHNSAAGYKPPEGASILGNHVYVPM